MSHLDSQFIVRRRLECGLSRRALARRLGVTTTTINSLEGEAQLGHLTLTFVSALADALSVRDTDLYARNESDDQARRPGPDEAKLAAVLASAGQAVGRDDIARGLSWSIERVEATAQALSERLAGTGQVVSRGDRGTIALRADSTLIGEAEWVGVERAKLFQHGTDRKCARMISQALAGGEGSSPAESPRRTGLLQGGDPGVQAMAIRAGLLEVSRGALVVTDDVRFSLGLSDERGTPAGRQTTSIVRRPRRREAQPDS